MTQKQRSLALLGSVLVFAACLGLYAWMGVFKTQKAKDEAKTANDVLYTYKKEQVKKLVVTSHGQETEADRTDSGWDIQRPVKTKGDKLAFDNIADKMANLKQKRDIGDRTDLTPYGLDHPKVQIVATLDDGTQHMLSIGSDNKYDNTVFAKGDGQRVSILETNIKYPLDKGLFELRNKQVFAFDDKDLRHLDVAVPGFAYGLDHTADNKWKVTAPTAMDADSPKCAQIANALKNLRATRFATDQATQTDLHRYGLDKPTLTVQYQLDPKDQKAEQETLTISVQKEDKADHAYVKVASEPFIAEVSPQIQKDLTVTLADLKDKTIFAFEQNAVKGFKFEIGATKFEVSKSGGPDAGPETWTLGGGASGAAKKWKLSALASSLHDLKGSSIVSENADAKALAAAGLDKPPKIVTILGDNEGVLGKLLIGKTEGAKVNVKTDASSKVFLIDNFKVNNAPSTVADIAEAVGDGGSATAQNGPGRDNRPHPQ